MNADFTQDLDIWTLIVHASIVVKVVMAILLVVSFMSWMFIFQKWFAIRRAVAQTRQVRARVLGRQRPERALPGRGEPPPHASARLERIFEAGFREFAKLRGQRGTDAERHGRRRAPRDARHLPARDGLPRAPSRRSSPRPAR